METAGKTGDELRAMINRDRERIGLINSILRHMEIKDESKIKVSEETGTWHRNLMLMVERSYIEDDDQVHIEVALKKFIIDENVDWSMRYSIVGHCWELRCKHDEQMHDGISSKFGKLFYFEEAIFDEEGDRRDRIYYIIHGLKDE